MSDVHPMLIKVAGAIAVEQACAPDDWHHFEGEARAAIEALIKPDALMRDACLAELSGPTDSSPRAASWDAVRGYRAMLQSILGNPNRQSLTKGENA